MGQTQLNTAGKSLDPAILKMILEVLSFGIARSIINSAVEAVSQSAATDSVDENSDNTENLNDLLT